MSDGGMDAQSVRIPGVIVDEFEHEPRGSARPVGSAVLASAPETVTSPSAVPATDAAFGAASSAEADPTVDGGVDTAPAEKKKASPARGQAMAAGGRPVEAPGPPPGRPVWPRPMSADEDYVPEEFDVIDLTEVSRQINHARARIFRVSQALKLAQRTLAEAQSDYDREMRRQLVTISGGTEASRRAMAEINCEHLENRIIVGKQVVEEWRKRSVDARDDLKAIENISHNVRAQMDIR